MKKLEGKTFLVCGGCGFMGSNFLHYLLKNTKTSRALILDKLTYAGSTENLRGLPANRVTLIKGDICDTNLVKKIMSQSDFVVNFAAETHVDRSIHNNANNFLETNVKGIHSLLEALRCSSNVLKMVHISTDEVWGDIGLRSAQRFTEKSSFRPSSPYAASKAAGDLLIHSYVRTHCLPVIVSHSVNNFGPRQFPEKLIPFIALRTLNNQKLPIYGNGKNVRDWLYVDDHSNAILVILEKSKCGESFAISGNDEHSNLDIVTKILDILQKPSSLIAFVEDRPGHDRRYSVDSSKLRRLGWKPKYSLDDKLSFTLKWYQENQSWVRSILKRKDTINEHIKI